MQTKMKKYLTRTHFQQINQNSVSLAHFSQEMSNNNKSLEIAGEYQLLHIIAYNRNKICTN